MWAIELLYRALMGHGLIGSLFTFHGNGEGEVTREFIDQSGQLSEDTTKFGWVLNEAGNVELTITDVDGVTDKSYRVYDEKLAALQVRTMITDESTGETVVRAPDLPSGEMQIG